MANLMQTKSLISFFIMSLSLGLWSYEAKCDFDSVVTEIVRGVKPYIKNLPRSADVYSYTTRTKVGIPDTGEVSEDDLKISTYLRNKSEIFWQLDKQNWDLSDTDGLYAAIDAVASREYFGKEHWILYRITLPAGYTYLDLRESYSNTVMDTFRPIQSQLAALGCDPLDAKSFYHLLMKNVGGPACKKIALEVFKHLNVDAIGYEWSGVAFRDCPKRAALAFIILKLPTQLRSIQAFMAEISHRADSASTERLMIESLFHQVIGYGRLNNLGNFSIDRRFWPWPELDSQVVGLDTKSWMKDHLMFCDETAMW